MFWTVAVQVCQPDRQPHRGKSKSLPRNHMHQSSSNYTFVDHVQSKERYILPRTWTMEDSPRFSHTSLGGNASRTYNVDSEILWHHKKIWLNQAIQKVYLLFMPLLLVVITVPACCWFVSAGVPHRCDKEETHCEHRNSYCLWVAMEMLDPVWAHHWGYILSWQHWPHMNSNRGLSAREVTQVWAKLHTQIMSWISLSIRHAQWLPAVLFLLLT